MGNTPSHQASPARNTATGEKQSTLSSNSTTTNTSTTTNNNNASSSRNPNLRLPMPQRPAHVSPNSSNPTSPSGGTRNGSPRRRKSLELPDLNKLSFTPAAPVPTLATHTSHHLATPSGQTNKRSSTGSTATPSSVPSGGRWRAALSGRVASPLAGGQALGAMSRIDGSGSVPAPLTAPVVMPNPASTQPADNPYFPPSPSQASPSRRTNRPVMPISIPGREASPARRIEPLTHEGTQPPPPTMAPTPSSRVSRERLSGDDGLVNVPISWNGGGKNVYVTGNFADNWKGRIKLNKSTHDFNTVLRLPPGQYRLKFIVDDSWRCSKHISTATDDDGTLVNWIEVETPKSEEELKSEWSTGSKPALIQEDADDSQWTSTIPAALVLYQYLEELPMTCSPADYDDHVSRFPHMTTVPQPPTLPRILDKVILNSEPRRTWDDPGANQPGLDDNSILPVPNHVVLNHLTASAIKNGTLGVGTTTRYRKKYITTMYFKPTLGDLMDGPAPNASPEVPTTDGEAAKAA